MKPASDVQSRHALFYLKRYRATVTLIGISALIFLFAFLAYPRHASVNRPPPFTVDLHVPSSLAQSLSISVEQLPSEFETRERKEHPSSPFLLSITVDASVANSARARALRPSVVVSLSAGHPDDCGIALWYPSTSNLKCNFAAPIDNSPGGYLGNASRFVRQSDGSWEANFNYEIDAATLGWDTNGVNLDAQLPVVTCTPVVSCEQLQDNANNSPLPGVGIYYHMPNAANYDWTGGPAPSTYNSPLNFSSAKYGAFWYPTLDSLRVPTFISATDNSAAQRDNLRTFAAGALVGIAGGAFVGGIQEAFHLHEGELRQPARPVAPEDPGDAAEDPGDAAEDPGDAPEQPGDATEENG